MKKENRCQDCEHHSGGTRPICNAPLPFWAEPYQRPTIYGVEGVDCPQFEDFRE